MREFCACSAAWLIACCPVHAFDTEDAATEAESTGPSRGGAGGGRGRDGGDAGTPGCCQVLITFLRSLPGHLISWSVLICPALSDVSSRSAVDLPSARGKLAFRCRTLIRSQTAVGLCIAVKSQAMGHLWFGGVVGEQDVECWQMFASRQVEALVHHRLLAPGHEWLACIYWGLEADA